MEQLESKINTELDKLKGHIAQMETELETYNDLDTLKETAEEKKRVRGCVDAVKEGDRAENVVVCV